MEKTNRSDDAEAGEQMEWRLVHGYTKVEWRGDRDQRRLEGGVLPHCEKDPSVKSMDVFSSQLGHAGTMEPFG